MSNELEILLPVVVFSIIGVLVGIGVGSVMKLFLRRNPGGYERFFYAVGSGAIGFMVGAGVSGIGLLWAASAIVLLMVLVSLCITYVKESRD